jgi:hypothetical protein
MIDKTMQDKRLAIVEIAKNRNGPVHYGIHLNFDAEFTRFTNRKEHGVDGVEFAEEVVEPPPFAGNGAQ